MKKPIIKIIVQFIFLELLFLFLLNLGLVFLPHQDIETVYYIHVNFYYLIACYSFLNYWNSKLNRTIIILFFSISIYLCISTLATFFVWPDYQNSQTYYLWYKINYFNVNSIILLTSIYLFLYIKYPYKNIKFHLLYSFIFTSVVSILVYSSLFVSDQLFYFSFDEISGANNKMFFISFSVLLLFWYEYSKQKHYLSEYISNIIIVFTIMSGMEILHIFLMNSEIAILREFYNLGQYFTSILNLLMLFIWVQRLVYLQSPKSEENEHYIKNYNKLYGFIKKPRTGLFEDLYYSLNPRIFWIVIAVSCIIALILMVFNQLNLFIKRNILLIIFAFVISIIFTMMYWHKRWYQSTDFLFKKKKK